MGAPIEQLAGIPLEVLREQFEQELRQIISRLENHCADQQRGGFFCRAEGQEECKSAARDGQGLWTFSFLYNRVLREQRYLEIAARTADFLLNVPPAEGLWPRRYTREGELLEAAAGEVVGDLEIACGLAEYAETSGEEAYRDMARQIGLRCLELYDRPDYGAGAQINGLPVPPGARRLSLWAGLLRWGTALLRRGAHREVNIASARSVAAVLNHHYHPELGLLSEVIGGDTFPLQGPWGRYVCSASALAALEAILAEAVRGREEKLFDLAGRYFWQHLESAWDRQEGGVRAARSAAGWSAQKPAGVQEQALTGTMALVEHRGGEWEVEMCGRLLKYQRAQPESGQPDFHCARRLMLGLLSLDGLIARKGRPSGVFGEPCTN